VAGFAVGGDFGNAETARIGLAGSYTRMNVRSQYDSNMLGVNSYQVTGYGWFKPLHSPIFTEVILGLANNQYHNTRQIHIDDNLNTAAVAHYHGHYYGGEIDVGYSFVKEGYYAAPLVRIRANHLNLHDYTETGAQGLNLSVNSQRLDQFSAGGGLRVARKMQSLMPEASFIVMHDFVDSNQEVLSSFIGGGEALPTGGIQPSKTLYQTSLGVSTINTQHYKITARYEYDFRKGFQSHAGFLQFNYFWN